MKERILIVEDEFIVANDLKIMLEKAGYDIIGIVPSVNQGKKLIAELVPDIVLLDIILKGKETGIDMAHWLIEQQIPFLYISATTNLSTLELVKETNPYGFIVKPFRERDLLIMLDIARYKIQLIKASAAQKPVIAPVFKHHELIGKSEPFKKVLDMAALVGPTDTSVLLLGESGTGKEKIAKYIHQISKRSQKPLVVINCGALPETLIESELFGHEKGAFTGASAAHQGKFERADRSTLFLDEIGELSLDLQTRLLRVLQEKEIEPIGSGKVKKVDVRIIAATHKNLEKEVANGNFRLDLYYRLNVFPIKLPGLRERKEDIEPLAKHFLKKIAERYQLEERVLSPMALSELKAYSWPGNIRELENMMERCTLLYSNGIIDFIPLPAERKQEEKTEQNQLETIERNHILKILEMCNGKIDETAAILKISSATLLSKMNKLGIKQKK